MKTKTNLAMDALEGKYRAVLVHAACEGKIATPSEEVLMRIAYYRGVSDGLDMAKTISSTEETSIVETP